MDTKIGFTNEETIAFIEMYRKREVLWNPKHCDHYSKIRKEDAWEEIAKETRKTVYECKKKMEYLLAALRREKMKIKRSYRIGKGIHEVYRSSWFAFESMRFILDKNKPKRTLSTISKPYISTRNEGSKPIKIVMQKMESDQTSRLSTSDAHLIPERRKMNISDERFEKAFEILTASTNQYNDDSYHFGNLVASKLRNYNDSIRCAIQNDILQLFLKANRGYYDNFNDLPNTILDNTHFIHPGYPPNYTHPSPSHMDITESKTSSPTDSKNAEDFHIPDLV